ncbi:ABC transporter substrate-binding protein [Agromyces sp. NPDC049794]|uniref:ABC transporter substrate-binding protein n=1 Tax=unclassified Agromyces TaxID=2639701 RepID=UPI0033D06200
MSKFQVRRGAIVAAFVAGALTLSGCVATTASEPDAGSDSTEPQGVWVRALNGDPMAVGMNAQLTAGTVPSLFSAQLFDPLIFLSPEDGSLNPGLAESWELSEDGLELTFELRDGVTWHDGEPFTAEDVVFNYEEIVPLQTYGAALASHIESVEGVDEDTVVLTLAEAYGPLLETVATQYMLPRHLYEGTDYLLNPANKAPVGTGPMKYETYSPGESVTLAANTEYWGPVPRVAEAVYTVIPDPNSRMEALSAGEIDQAIIEPSHQGRVADADDLQLIQHGDYPQVVTMTFNARNPALASPEARAAVFAALDREELVEVGMSGVGEAATGFFPESLDWARDPDIDFDEDFPRDLDAIEEALDDAGFPRGADGTRFTVKIVYIQTLTEVVGAVELAQSMLHEIGIESTLVPSTGPAYSEALYSTSDFDLAFSRASIGPDPSLGIATRYICAPKLTSGYNPSDVCDEKIEAAAAEALTTVDQEERGEAFRVLQQRARDLMFFTPIAWFNGAFPTVYTGRWDGQDDPRDIAERMPWSTMTLVG